ncbi:hypothetical protein [Consotaella salsifontis]|uniref:hypothetical protein n=1 Tax=Consotaella salsifontis TaxID=1365950 RepID=UPI0010566BA0|nr:hypothetical protein [Consotaella salsifontis]
MMESLSGFFLPDNLERNSSLAEETGIFSLDCGSDATLTNANYQGFFGLPQFSHAPAAHQQPAREASRSETEAWSPLAVGPDVRGRTPPRKASSRKYAQILDEHRQNKHKGLVSRAGSAGGIALHPKRHATAPKLRCVKDHAP